MAELALAVSFLGLAYAAEALEISLQHGSTPERRTRDQLLEVLKRYDTQRWTFTRKIIIDEGAIPHSHPVLTLHTRHLGEDLLLLSTYVHEQIHWYEESKPKQRAAALAELKKLYPEVPVGFPEGAGGEESSYLHLIVCYDEYQAMKSLVGERQATEIMRRWSEDHYRWVYRKVLEDEARLRAVVEENELGL